MLTAMLPTTFGRAVLVALIEYLIGFAIGAVVIGIFFLLGINLLTKI
jgi:hypothetical protein